MGHLQTMYLTRGQYPKYVKTSFNSTTTTKKNNSQFKKWVENPNRHFSKLLPPKQAKKQNDNNNNNNRGSQWIHRKMFNIIYYQGNANQNHKYRLMSILMTITKKARNNCWRECREKGSLVQPLLKTTARLLKNKQEQNYHTIQLIHFQVLIFT